MRENVLGERERECVWGEKECVGLEREWVRESGVRKREGGEMFFFPYLAS
jgi:hypothetical protein